MQETDANAVPFPPCSQTSQHHTARLALSPATAMEVDSEACQVTHSNFTDQINVYTQYCFFTATYFQK
jgi:hypothetical protein